MSDLRAPELAAWETVCSERVFDAGFRLAVFAETVQLPDGTQVSPFYTLLQPDFAVIAATDPSGRFLIQWSYRHGPRKVTLNLPSGLIEAGEAPLDAARRELIEETGCTSDSWEDLGAFTVNGNQGGGTAHMFLARDVVQVQEPDSGDLEEMAHELVSIDELRAHLKQGSVAVIGHATGILLSIQALEGDRLG